MATYKQLHSPIWFGLRVSGHLTPSLHSSNKLGELLSTTNSLLLWYQQSSGQTPI